MSTIITDQSPATVPEESLAQRFGRLAKPWLTETAYLSSTTAMVAHPAFQEIVAMGPPVIPLGKREVDKGTGH
jgi:hypothetical protein